MSKFIKLTVNDSLYDTLVSLSELYSLPVATLCNFFVSNSVNDVLDRSRLMQWIDANSDSGVIDSEKLRTFIRNQTCSQKVMKNIRVFRLRSRRRRGEKS